MIFLGEETVQLCLEKAKSPKDKNVVYIEVKVKLDPINVHETVGFLLKRERKRPNTSRLRRHFSRAKWMTLSYVIVGSITSGPVSNACKHFVPCRVGFMTRARTEKRNFLSKLHVCFRRFMIGRLCGINKIYIACCIAVWYRSFWRLYRRGFLFLRTRR